jgi:hypothetical protein
VNVRAKWFITAATIGLIALQSPESHADQKADDIRTLLQLTGRGAEQIEHRVDKRTSEKLQQFVDAHPELTGAEIEQLHNAVMANARNFVTGYEEALLDYYSARLTDNQVLQTIQFFRSPAGRHIAPPRAASAIFSWLPQAEYP